MTQERPRKQSQSSAILPSVKRDAAESPTQRANISDILRVPRPGPYFKIIAAASSALTARSMIAAGVAFFPMALASSLLSHAVTDVATEGRRTVMALVPVLLALIGAAGSVAVSARCARKRVEGLVPRPGLLAAWWVRNVGTTLGIPIAFGTAYVAFAAAVAAVASIVPASTLGVLRIVPLAAAAAMIACLGGLAIAAMYVAAIRAVENVNAGEAVAMLGALWKRARAPLLLHFAVIALTVGGYSIAVQWLASRTYALARVTAEPGTLLWTFYDDALFRTLSQAPPLAMLGAFGVASYLLLRQGEPAPVTIPEDAHGVDKDR